MDEVNIVYTDTLEELESRFNTIVSRLQDKKKHHRGVKAAITDLENIIRDKKNQIKNTYYLKIEKFKALNPWSNIRVR